MTVVVAAVVEQDGRILVTSRPPGVHLAGLWEFPGGKIDPGETHQDALRRELREELGTDARIGELILATSHAYADRSVSLYFYRCALVSEPRPLLGQKVRWVSPGELAGLEFPPADEKLIRLLRGTATR